MKKVVERSDSEGEAEDREAGCSAGKTFPAKLTNHEIITTSKQGNSKINKKEFGNVTMKNIDWTWIVILIGASIVILAIISCSANAGTITIHDGDTITVNGERIRLYGIDAPENDQPYGAEARAALAAMVAQAGPTLRLERRGGPDRYGRTLAIVYAGRKSINAAMVESGAAWAYLTYSSLYASQERAARRAMRGLWALPCPVAPWQYRNG